MTLRAIGLACATSILLVVAPAGAEEPLGRYTMKDIDDGMLRLDTATGEVSYCRKKDDTWACDAATGDRSDLAEEVARLQEENAELRNRLAELEKEPENQEADRLKIPSDQELDQVMDFMDRLMRRFYAFTKSMREQLEDKRPGEDT